MAGFWATTEEAGQSVKTVTCIVLILLVLAFGCGFVSGLLTALKVTTTDSKAQPTPLPCNPATDENCP